MVKTPHGPEELKHDELRNRLKWSPEGKARDNIYEMAINKISNE